MDKKEEKAIRKGYAYKSWKRKNVLMFLCVLIWFFIVVPLLSSNSVTKVISIVGTIVLVILELYFFKSSCWKCPQCKGKLPIKQKVGYYRFQYPELIRECPYCGFDLTVQRLSNNKNQ